MFVTRRKYEEMLRQNERADLRLKSVIQAADRMAIALDKLTKPGPRTKQEREEGIEALTQWDLT